VPMLCGMTERGPDSAGLAVFSSVQSPALKLSLFQLHGAPDWGAFMRRLNEALPGEHGLHEGGRHAVLATRAQAQAVKDHIAGAAPGVVVLSQGHRIELYKDTGAPGSIAERYGFAKLAGSHAVGHTRMATESAVTPAHAHPFTAGEDFCLVHNGSLSNPYRVRRRLEPLGIHFETDNDTEAACRFLEWRMREGDGIEAALTRGFEELDGFFTFLIGTRDGMSLVRDPFACKPAIVAETDDYVAVASEFRSLAHLPGVSKAKLFEPQPRTIYHWERT
jgi:glutamate synthase domain-containing protein 1